MNDNSTTEIKDLINEICIKIKQNYVFPGKVERIVSKLNEKCESGQYSQLKDFKTLANILTDDLQNFAQDFHFYCEFNPKKASNPQNFSDEGDPEEVKEWIKQMEYLNYDIPTINRLPGNIGYIKLNSFKPAENAGELIWAAFTFLKHTNALIIDIRYNGGGDETMVQFILSYLTKNTEPLHLKTFYTRKTDSHQQSWTLPFIPGKRYHKPVYVLTSRRSASAAEAFAYDIKHFKLGTLIGETTRGAANIVGLFPLKDKFVIDIPIGRPIHMKTTTNWEGQGVTPHIEINQNQALEKANILAVENLLECELDEEIRVMLQFELAFLRTFYNQKNIDSNDYIEFLGKYGNYELIDKDGILFFRYRNIDRKLITSDGITFFVDESMKLVLTRENNGFSYLSLSFRDFPGKRKIKKALV